MLWNNFWYEGLFRVLFLPNCNYNKFTKLTDCSHVVNIACKIFFKISKFKAVIRTMIEIQIYVCDYIQNIWQLSS